MFDDITAKSIAVAGWSHLVDSAARAEAVGGRLSEAPLWRIQSAAGEFSLRGWRREQRTAAEQVHTFLRRLDNPPEVVVAVPRPSSNEQFMTLCDHHNFLWELAPWLPGETSFQCRPNTTALSQGHLQRTI